METARKKNRMNISACFIKGGKTSNYRIAAAIAVLAVSIFARTAIATPVTAQEAERAAAAWLKTGSAPGLAQGATTDGVVSHAGRDGQGAFYIVKLKKADGSPGGFAAVSADRRLNPVLAYFEGEAFEASEKNPVWSMLSTDAAGCAAALEKADAAKAAGTRASAGSAGSAASKAEKKWARLLGEASGGRAGAGASSKSAVSDVRVAPLLKTTWYQTGHGENLYTPNQYLSGCSATAGAQIMRYWRWPQESVTAGRSDFHGKVGETGDWTLANGWRADENSAYIPWNPSFGGIYDWNNMPAAGGATDAEQQAIGKLLRDVGISCFMSYDGGGGSAVFALFYYRLTDTFQYANSAFFLNYDRSRENDAVRAILSSLNLKSPCGVSVPGHSIVADGYGYDDGTLYIHFNLGWGGNWNLWYNPPDLSEAGDGYTTLHTIIYNIYPPSVSTVKDGTIVSGRVLGRNGTPFPGAAVTAVNKSTGAEYTATADAKGIYAIPVPAANYTLTAAAAGVSAVMDKTVGKCYNGGVASDLSAYTSAGETANIADADFTLDAVPPDEVPDLFLEYVESDGTQFVDTELKAIAGTKVECSLANYNKGAHTVFMGAGKLNSADSCIWMMSFKTYYLGYGYGSVSCYVDTNPSYGSFDSCSKLDGSVNDGQRYGYTAEMSSTGVYTITATGANLDGGIAKKDASASVGGLRTTNNFYLFASNADGSPANHASVKCYGVKIWQTNGVDGTYVLLRDFRPCIKNRRPGLYDAVSERIFYSGSNYDLLAPYIPVDYVESTGSQFIDTGVEAKTGTKAEMHFQWKAFNGKQYLLSATASGKHFNLCGNNGYWYWGGYDDGEWYVDEQGGSFATSIAENRDYSITTEISPAGLWSTTVEGIGSAQDKNGPRTADLSLGVNLYAFANNNDGTANGFSQMRLYGMKIWQTNGVDGTYVLVRDFKPCHKDGRAGLVDMLTGTLYFSGSGTDLDMAPVVWNNTAGDNSFDNPANWSTGSLPQPGDAVVVNISGDTVLNVTRNYKLSKMSVAGSGTLSFTEATGTVLHNKLDIAEGVSVKRPGTAGLVDGGLSGKGGFILDPGAGATVTMTKNNTAYTGEAVIASGTVKFGDHLSFGNRGRSAFIRVKGGAVLDENGQYWYTGGDGQLLSSVILEAGATFANGNGYDRNFKSSVTTLKLEGDATLDSTAAGANISAYWHDLTTTIDLGANTLSVVGGNAACISSCQIAGTGTIDVQNGATIECSPNYGNDATTTCNDGTIRIRDGGEWRLGEYRSHAAHLTVKNLILDGSVTRGVNTATLTVTGTISGKGTTPVLTMADGAKFAADGSGFLTVTESLSFQGSTVEVDISGVPPKTARVPLFKVGSAAMLPSAGIFRVSGDGAWCVKTTEDGLGYELQRTGFCIYIR